MDRDGSAAVGKLAATVAIAIVLLVLYRLWPDGPFAGLFAGVFGLVAGPILILVLIDTSRALRRQQLGRVARILAWTPQVFLGALACLAALAGLWLFVFGDHKSHLSRLWGSVVSLGLLSFGINLMRGSRADGPRTRE